MDVRHLTLLLVSRENKKYIDISLEICEFIRQKIDPFDYDVFYPYIQTNLKRSVQRVQVKNCLMFCVFNLASFMKLLVSKTVLVHRK